jgi:hypothetical protein
MPNNQAQPDCMILHRGSRNSDFAAVNVEPWYPLVPCRNRENPAVLATDPAMRSIQVWVNDGAMYLATRIRSKYATLLVAVIS